MADTDKVHRGSSGNRSASLLPAKQPISQPLPGYETLAGLRQNDGKEGKKAKMTMTLLDGGKKIRRRSRPGY